MIFIPKDKFILFIFYASLFFFVLDIFTNPCFIKNFFEMEDKSNLKKISLLEFLFLHHVLAVYLYFGWLAPTKGYLEIYVILVLVVVFHWMTNNQKCILTQIINWYCVYDDGEYFHDIFWFLGVKEQNNWFNWMFIYLVLLFGSTYALIKISYL